MDGFRTAGKELSVFRSDPNHPSIRGLIYEPSVNTYSIQIDIPKTHR